MNHLLQNSDQDPAAGTATLFLPGWGFDSRILRLLQPVPAWIAPGNFIDPATITADILSFFPEKNARPARIIGWSMGAMLALDFAARHPEKVDSLILVSLRRDWPNHETAELQNEFKQDPATFLKGFYRKCFLGDRDSYRKFCADIEPSCLDIKEDDIDRLQKGLEYLRDFSIPAPVPGIPVRLIHGGQDIVAPAAEMADIQGAEIEVIENSGHAPFLAAECSLQVELKKQAIQARFSRAAGSYDSYAKVQSEVARKLAEKANPLKDAGEVHSILEIGCGTGNFTGLLVEKFPGARITAVDFSPDMIGRAEQKLKKNNISFVCAEGEEFLKNSPETSFDLVASNGSLQWFSEHDRALGDIARILKPGGALLCSIFGPDSLKKLGLGLNTLFDYQGNVAAGMFPGISTLQSILERHFSQGAIEQELFEKEYDSVLDLLVHIKKTGTGGWHRHGLPTLTPARLRQLDRWFNQTYGGCKVNYQVHFLQAVK